MVTRKSNAHVTLKLEVSNTMILDMVIGYTKATSKESGYMATVKSTSSKSIQKGNAKGKAKGKGKGQESNA